MGGKRHYSQRVNQQVKWWVLSDLDDCHNLPLHKVSYYHIFSLVK